MDEPIITLPSKPWTPAKHNILSKYLSAWFPILERYHGKIAFLDGFCGPGVYEDGGPGSPLIALDIAANHRRGISSEVVFWFIDKDPNCIAQLELELAKRSFPENFTIIRRCARFNEVVDEFMTSTRDPYNRLVPTFAFIDPCGFSGVPFAAVGQLLRNDRCEVLINLMVDFINRFLTHPDPEVIGHIVEAFGTEDVLEIAKRENRVSALVRFYEERLRSLGLADFVRPFEIVNERNKPVYDLIFATNHELGFARMKEAMWHTDPTGQYRFCSFADGDGAMLFGPEVQYLPKLKAELMTEFGGRGEVTGASVARFVTVATDFLQPHKKAALDELKGEARLKVNPMKVGNRPYLHGYPEDCLLTFE